MQHYYPSDFGSCFLRQDKKKMERVFKGIKYKDKIKNEFAKRNGFEIIRIPYWRIKKINDILKSKLGIP